MEKERIESKCLWYLSAQCPTSSIGFSIAKKLKEEGAHVMVSSRKEENVKNAVEKLRQEEGGGQVEGMVCHVGKEKHRVNLVKEVFVCLGWGSHSRRGQGVKVG